MAKGKAVKRSGEQQMMRPALTPEARENQLISLASDLAEKQLREGTASSQVITHYLKLGSTKERIEKVGYSSINAFIVSAVMEKLEKEENF